MADSPGRPGPASSPHLRIVIPGGSGLLGTSLARALTPAGHDVTVLSRLPRPAPWRVLAWDPDGVGPWARAFDGADVVISLAGRSVNCRYTPEHRQEILHSRVASVEAVSRAIAAAARPPRVWLQASTATIYAHTEGPPHDEATGVLGGHEPGAPETWRFSIDVAMAWEQSFRAAIVPGTRKVLLRSAVVMSPQAGGAFDILRGLARCGLGGPQGNGRQFVSWVHEADFVRAVAFLIAREDLDDAINIASPHPLRNRSFMAALRQACGAPIGLPTPAWLLELGAFFLRTETELVLKSRRVVPKRLLDAGFTFLHPDWPQAARDLCDAMSGGRTAAASAVF